MVQVDVVVVDADGNAVRGLKQSDFTVFDRRKLQKIAVFEEVSYERPADSPASLFPPTLRMDVADNQTARADRLVMMVVDDLHVYKNRTEDAKTLIRTVINELGPHAAMAMIFTSGDHSTQVTEDRSILLGAAETLKGRQSVRRPNPAIDLQTPTAGDPEQDPLLRLDEVSRLQKVSLQDFEDNLTLYKTLQDAARMLGADDARRKAFVLVSEGINKDLTGMFETETTPCETQQANPGTNTPSFRPPPCYHDIALRQMMESMHRSNVATYVLDPRGHVSPQDLLRENFPDPPGLLGTSGGTAGDEDSQFRWDNPVRRAQRGLQITAEASGGFAVTDTDDFGSGIQHIIEDLDHYYLLGFNPSDPGGKIFRPLAVKIEGHPEWRLRFRKGYMPGGPPALPANADPLVALSAGVMPKGDLPLRLFAAPFPGARTPRVAVTLEVTAPAQRLKEADGNLHDDVSYEVLVVDEKKVKVTSRLGQAVRMSLKPRSTTGPSPEQVSYQIPLSLDLAPGRYQLRASAMSAKAGTGGSVYLVVDVPDFSKSAIALSGVVLGYADGSRVPVGRVDPSAAGRASRPPAGRAALPALPPLVELPFEPSLSREFATTDTLRAYAEVVRKNPGAPVHVTVALLDVTDTVVRTSDRDIAANAGGQVDVSLPLAGLQPGAYRLQVTASDGKAQTKAEVGLAIR